MDDSELALFRAGDPAFFRKLNRRHRGFLMGVILSFQQDADWAEELYQQVWIAIWKQRKALRRGRSFAAWAGRIARNACLMEIRVRKRQADRLTDLEDLPPQSEPVDQTVDPLTQAERSEFRERVIEELQALPKAQREAFHLVHIESRSTREAAELLGVETGTVRSNVRHAAKQLAKRLPEFRP